MKRLRVVTILFLLAAAVALGLRLREEWRAYRAANDPQALKLRPAVPLPVPGAAPAKDYSMIAQQNPFHPERNDVVPPSVLEAKQALGPPPLVFGSMILGRERFALLASESDPKPRKVVEGEMFGGYKLAEVKAQSVVLEAEGAKNEVMFYNALTRLRREGVKTPTPAGAATTTAGGTPAAATTTVSSAAGTPAAAAATRAEPPAPPGKKYIDTLFGRILVDDK